MTTATHFASMEAFEKGGVECMNEYTDPKSVWVNYAAEIPPFYKRS